MYTLDRDFEEPLTVEKIRPDGYLLLNRHHRWAAAMRMGVRRVPIHIVNLTQTADIQKMLQNAKHDKSVALDLDEVVFASGREMAMEKALPFPARRVYKERLRYGIPALFRFFKSHGYDIWVYTAQYYSMEYIQHLFKWYGVKIDNIVTGILRKNRDDAEVRKRMQAQVVNRYSYMIHLDANSIMRVNSSVKSYEDYSPTGNSQTWSREIMEIVERFEKHKG